MSSATPSDYPRILPAGDQAVTVEFGDRIDLDLNRRVYAFAEALEEAALPGVVEAVPSYRSLLVQYDVHVTRFAALRDALTRFLDRLPEPAAGALEVAGEVFELPVLYGGDEGPDLSDVAAHAGLSPEEVIAIHSSTAYRVYMLGFAPGFPYLGGMDPRIACPRLSTPRVRVAAGSVGIAESQTGVYPLAGPGGWRIIGRTPVPLFTPESDPPVAILPGRFIRFAPVDAAQAAEIESSVAAGTYTLRRREGTP
ncbi:MAG: 5-oxoprolinase subunit PxpB [Gemmatimonadetes bacterium]|nr:5-oxoprolinase subunit PxpB [Gemmatimonadota bacterium]